MTTKDPMRPDWGKAIGLLLLAIIICFNLAYCALVAVGVDRINKPVFRKTNMTEAQLDALVHFVRREAEFAEERAKGKNPSPRDVKYSEEEFRDAMRDER